MGLLLLLYLQNTAGLEVYQIALVYLPGGIALTVLPRVLHRYTERRGRRAGYVAASVCSGVAAGCLAFTPSAGDRGALGADLRVLGDADPDAWGGRG
ncbi:hypothetical protein FYJ28_02690 [Arthrobacter sp. BL-252-APC-1A]|uniref:hypothetical protein n=1 Tax=Arthrobacter sp. BL-252-APC-1A TaxID=2606622 RepID=UPI0012B18AE3|nr:hypothetical protein [Arthrobacter sp. BL-252-APC-1A]MSR97728.1 hypothetical protein [Arthrobacter sp. BL-252-APC-1A]